MSRFRKITVSISLVLVLLQVLSPSFALGAETEYPQGVATAEESTVQVTAWIDGEVSGGAGWRIDHRSSGPWSFEARGPWAMGSGFFANEAGDVFTAAHVVELEDEELAEGAIMYFLGGIWFEDEWYEDYDFGTFYSSLYSGAWELWYDDELEITAEEVDYVYRAGEGEPVMVQEIRFWEDPESGMDIAILETGLNDTPYIGLRQEIPLEGSQAYVIGYAGIDLMLEFWQAMDDIMEDPQERPDSFSELMRRAEERMVECLKEEGPSIETGLLGSSTKIYGMDARRFYGAAWSGFSGGPVVDEFGNCLGLLPWGEEGGRGWFIPAEHLNEASQDAGIDIYPALEIGSVAAEPAFVEAGQSFEVRAEVSNLGFVEGDYTAPLKLDDGTEASQGLTIGAGETKTLVLSAVKKSSGFSTGSLGIGRMSVDLGVGPIEFSNLSVKPVLVAPGEDVRVQAEVSNVSEEMSVLAVNLSIDGAVETTKTVTLEGGATETVTFLVTRDTAGTYQVAIGNLKQEFTVESEFPLTLVGLAIAGFLGLVGVVLGALAFIRSRG